MEKYHAIENIIQLTNKNAGFTPTTPCDFNTLSIKILKKTQNTISVSSLKRLWGYVQYRSMPSPSTLNILARFNGYSDWETFAKENSTATSETSEFLQGEILDLENVQKGEKIEINWERNKRCLIQNIKDNIFRVIEADNIKLKEGDIFQLDNLCVGMPLCARDIKRNSLTIPAYIGARKEGIKKWSRFEIND